MAKHLGNRRVAVCAWLTANGINPNDVPQDADMTIHQETEGRVLQCEVYDRAPDGTLQSDERGDRVALKVVTVPLKVEPPEWWEPYEKPTRNDLLVTVRRLRELVGGDPDATDENIDGWNQAMDAVKAVLDGKAERRSAS